MFYFLIKYFLGSSSFSAITIRSMFSLLTAFIITLLITPYLIKKMKTRKISQPIRNSGPESHIKNKTGTPSMGGIGITLSVILSVFFWSNLNVGIVVLLILYVNMAIIGLIDDIKKFNEQNSSGISAKTKIILQLFAGVIFLFFCKKFNLITNKIYIPIINTYFNAGNIYYIFTLIVIIGTTNAVNLTDGLDGLAMGVSSIVILSYGILAYLSGHAVFSEYLKIPHLNFSSELLVVTAAILGSGLGFLWYNSYPAEVFMGDTGSLSLGSIIGGIAILIKQEVILLIIGGIFVIEALSVIIQVTSFKLYKKRIFKMAPIHHHFELLGWHEPKVVFRFWLITFILILIGFSVIGFNIIK